MGAFSPRLIYLWTMTTLLSLLWNAQFVNAQIVPSLTVDISIDEDGRITFDQVGLVTPPFFLPGDNPLAGTFPSSMFGIDGQGTEKSVGCIWHTLQWSH